MKTKRSGVSAVKSGNAKLRNVAKTKRSLFTTVKCGNAKLRNVDKTKRSGVSALKGRNTKLRCIAKTKHCLFTKMNDEISKVLNLFNKKLIISSIGVWLIAGCASTYTKTSPNCLTYTISGDKSEEWAPIDFYQDETENKLYMQLPKYINYVPTLRVVDTEYNQPYTVDYKYNKETHRLEVRDNYDQYVLTRNSYDDLSPDKVYVTCNRSIEVKKNK